MSYREVSEVRDGMRIDWDMPIEMDDGLVLRGDVFRPIKKGRYPVHAQPRPLRQVAALRGRLQDRLEPHGAQAPGRHGRLDQQVPELGGLSIRRNGCRTAMSCVRVDSRGCGRSPGYVEHWSPRETKDFHDCIEWAGVQPWSNGKVGLNGISYYAMNQWQVASLQPKHLAAICVWEGFADFYRELSHNGGILNTFAQNWYDMQVKTVQHGLGTKGYRSRMNGDWVSGPETLTDEQLGANRYDLGKTCFAHPLDDEFYKAHVARLVEGQGAAALGRQLGRPARCIRAAISRASSALGVETEMARGARHRALDALLHRLRRRDCRRGSSAISSRARRTAGTSSRACSSTSAIRARSSSMRHEDEWPLPRTQWTKFHLDRRHYSCRAQPARRSATVTFDALGDGVTFLTEPMQEATEITGPVAAKLHISSSTDGRRHFPGAAGVLARHEGGRVPGRARPAHADRRKAGCAPRIASSTRS